MKFYGEVHNGKYVDQDLREYFPDYTYKGVFFDVGAYNSVTVSNSHHFYENGWDVFCFEANPENVENLKKQRNHVYHCAVSDIDNEETEFNIVETTPGWTASYSGIEISDEYKSIFGFSNSFNVKKIKCPQKTLNTIISESIPGLDRIDILSIDVEGGELNVLKGLDIKKYKPRVICLEDVSMKNKFYPYLSEFGYKFHKNNAYNYFYVSSDDFDLK